MKTLLTNAKVIDPVTETISYGEVMFENGIIIPKSQADETIDCRGQYISPGLIDLGVKVGEPGERHKESYKSAGAAAAARRLERSADPRAGGRRPCSFLCHACYYRW